MPLTRLDSALVLLKLRPYQDDIADVVHIYEKEEVNRLYEIGEITQLDPILHLPPEVLHTVLEHLNSERTTLSLVSACKGPRANPIRLLTIV